MIKTPLSTVIGGAGIWTPGCTVLGGQQNLDQLIKSLFANSEVGFAYDPNDLTTLYQDAAGTTPVTGAGQAVGLVLDKSKGLTRGIELWTDAAVKLEGESTRISSKTYRIYSSAGGYSGVTLSNILTIGLMYELSFDIDSIATLGTGLSNEGTFTSVFTSVGKKKVYFFASSTTAVIKRAGLACDIQISNVSIKQISGNHAYQATSSMRPLLLNSPRKIDYDAVDDKLVTNLPAQLTGCTVIRAVPNVGTQILTNQTIPTPYNDSTDHCGLIVINRALTATETAQITRLFNKASGV